MVQTEPSMLEVVMGALGFYYVQRVRREQGQTIRVGQPVAGPFETRDDAHAALMKLLDS